MPSVYPLIAFPTIRELPDSPLRRIADGIINLIFPDSCFVCDSPIARTKDCGVCGACWQKVDDLRIAPPWCPLCGLPFNQPDDDTPHLCGLCSQGPPPAASRSYGFYTAELARIIRGFKFEGRKNLAGLLVPLLAGTFWNSWDRSHVDLILPVPLHPKRKRERGYNQAALLAQALGKLLAIPCTENALRRVRYTAPQAGLTGAQRRRNLKGAFRCDDPRNIAGKRFLVIDDVMTTGTTVSIAAETLLEAGALRVSVLTIARAVLGLE